MWPHGPSNLQNRGTRKVLWRLGVDPKCILALCLIEKRNFKTFNKGSLGSRIDEERSKARYVM